MLKEGTETINQLFSVRIATTYPTSYSPHVGVGVGYYVSIHLYVLYGIYRFFLKAAPNIHQLQIIDDKAAQGHMVTSYAIISERLVIDYIIQKHHPNIDSILYKKGRFNKALRNVNIPQGWGYGAKFGHVNSRNA